MNHTTGAGDTPGYPISARVCESALGKVTRMFDRVSSTQARELAQNARRAGATRITVETHDHAEGGCDVSVADDGHGIADPAILLAFGASAWDAAGGDTAREDPAGLGLLCLAQERITIHCAHRADPGSPTRAWTTTLGPEHFAGTEMAWITPIECAPDAATGTRIAWRDRNASAHVARAWMDTGQYSALAITVNAQRVPHTDFLAGAVAQRPWHGGTIAIVRAHNRFADGRWHELTVGLHLPTLTTTDDQRWQAIADISTMDGITLVLPERKAVAHNAGLEALRDAAQHLLIETVAGAEGHRKGPPRLRCEDWQWAQAHGIALAPAPEGLIDYNAENEHANRIFHAPPDTGPWTSVRHADTGKPHGWIVGDNDERALGAAHAMLSAPNARTDGQPCPLWKATFGYRDYPWYRAMPRVRDVRAHITRGTTSEPLEDAYRKGFRGGPVDAVFLIVELGADGTSQTDANKWRWNRIVHVDAAIPATEEAWNNGADPAISRHREVNPKDVVNLLYHAYFHIRDDDGEWGSGGEQIECFRERALRSTHRALMGREGMLREALERNIAERARDVMPHGSQASVAIARAPGGQVEVRVEYFAEHAAPADRSPTPP